jgi:hypothetical protein
MISTYGATTLSDAALGTGNVPTGTLELNIEAGDKPLYIFASSYEPLIWRITGHAERVARFVALAIRNVGVIGLPRTAVSLRPGSVCPGWAANAKRSNVKFRSDSLARMLGASRVLVLAAHYLSSASIPSDLVEADDWVTSAETAYPSREVVHVDGGAVLTNDVVEPYKAPPKWPFFPPFSLREVSP